MRRPPSAPESAGEGGLGGGFEGGSPLSSPTAIPPRPVSPSDPIFEAWSQIEARISQPAAPADHKARAHPSSAPTIPHTPQVDATHSAELAAVLDALSEFKASAPHPAPAHGATAGLSST